MSSIVSHPLIHPGLLCSLPFSLPLPLSPPDAVFVTTTLRSFFSYLQRSQQGFVSLLLIMSLWRLLEVPRLTTHREKLISVLLPPIDIRGGVGSGGGGGLPLSHCHRLKRRQCWCHHHHIHCFIPESTPPPPSPNQNVVSLAIEYFGLPPPLSPITAGGHIILPWSPLPLLFLLLLPIQHHWRRGENNNICIELSLMTKMTSSSVPWWRHHGSC